MEPHHLVTWKGRWYLVAWDLDRDDWRTFRCRPGQPAYPDRTTLHPTTTTQRRRGHVRRRPLPRFRPTPRRGPAWGEVILDLPASVVAAYTRDGLVEELGPDRCRLVQGSWSWVGLAAALGRFDADIEVIGPVELKAAFAGLARRYADAAGNTKPGAWRLYPPAPGSVV